MLSARGLVALDKRAIAKHTSSAATAANLTRTFGIVAVVVTQNSTAVIHKTVIAGTAVEHISRAVAIRIATVVNWHRRRDSAHHSLDNLLDYCNQVIA